MQGLLITDIDSYNGMQARNIVVLGHDRPATLRNSLLRQETESSILGLITGNGNNCERTTTTDNIGNKRN